MQIEAIPMLINSDFMEIPLDKRLDLADYKMYGEKSHVFQNKDRLHSLYECVGLSMNDLTINSETLEYFIKENQMGLAFASIYGIKNVQTLAALTAMTAVLDSSTAMTAVANSSTAMTAVLGSSTAMTAVVDSSTAMTAVANSSTAIAGICKSGYNTTKAVIKAVNNNEDYIKKVFDTVTSDNSKFLLTANEKEDGVTVLDRFCNTPNTIILCALGSYRGSGSTNLLINNELSKVSNSAGIKPSYVVKENCNAIAVPTATFTENGDGYAAIAVYKAI